MKQLLFLLFALFIAGCGDLGAQEKLASGIFVDSATEAYLRSEFDEAKTCTGFSEGKFEDLSVLVMPPSFPCRYYSNGCNGEYVAPNSIKIGSLPRWKHEVLHYLLYVNTGDPGTDHQSTFPETGEFVFASCS